MQSLARVHSSPPQGPGRDHRQPTDSSLAQLLQRRLAIAPTPAGAPSFVGERELAAVRPLPTQFATQGRRELEESLATIHSHVQAVHRKYQLARQAGPRLGAGHLRLVPLPE
jgi:hypothetical protein